MSKFIKNVTTPSMITSKDSISNININEKVAVIPCRILKKYKQQTRDILNKYKTSKPFEFDNISKDIEEVKFIQKRIQNQLEKHKYAESRYGDEDRLEYEKTKEFNEVLNSNIKYLETILKSSSNMESRRLLFKKEAILETLNSKEGLEAFAIRLFQQVELAKYQLSQYITRRLKLEVTFEKEMNELNGMILAESQIRCELAYKLDKAIQTKRYIIKTIESMKEKLNLLLESREFDIEEEEEKRRESLNIPSLSHEMFNILSLTNDIDKNLGELESIIDCSHDEVVVIPDEKIKVAEQKVHQLAQEMAIRVNVEKRNVWLQTQLRSVKQSLQNEISERVKLEELAKDIH